jgi:hypothetical protein
VVSENCIPKGALIAIGDMLDSCLKVLPGQELLLVADIKGLHGGDDMVDGEAINWIQGSVRARGANASVLWIDELPKAHAWRLPPVAKAAMAGCDILINNCFFTLPTTEMPDFRAYYLEKNFKMLRNFATTSSLLCTAWAQTPTELVNEIRYHASLAFVVGQPFQLTDPNGTHLEGTIRDPQKQAGIPGGTPYSERRGPQDNMFPWPEWMHTPVQVLNTSGVYIFENMLSWWSRYIGISPYFDKPIELTIKDNRITEIEGGDEAEALKRFLKMLKGHLGDDVYKFPVFHFGVHPQASVSPHQCPNPLIRRIIDHSHTRNLHFHIGDAKPTPAYPYYLHITADIRTPTLRVGNTLVYDRGHLTVLDNPEVLAVTRKYPGRPGIDPAPRSF